MLYKNGKLFGWLNILDLLVLVVIILAGIILAPNFFGGTTNVIQVSDGEDKTVYFTVEFPQTTMEFVEKVSIGDAIKDNVRGDYYGEVFDIRYEPAKIVSENIVDGSFQYSEVPGEVDVYLTVKANGTESSREIKAEGQTIKLGKLMALKGKGYASAGYIVQLYTE